MTVRTPPTFLQAGAHTAENTRLALQGFWGSPQGSFSGGVGADDPAHGVARVGSNQLRVTENGTPNMSVNVAAGHAWIRGTESASQGSYHFFNAATVNLSISAADATNARRDLIVAQVRDSGYSGSDDDARLFVVEGTPSGSPADPAVPANCLVLARVAVAAGATSIVTANITDLRVYTRPWNTAWGVVAIAERTSDQTFSTTSFVDATDLSVTFAGPGGRRYEITGYVRLEVTTGTGFNARLQLADGSNTQLQLAERVMGTDSVDQFTLTDYRTPGSGSVTYKLRGACSVSSRAWTLKAGLTARALLIVKDLGPS